MPRYDYQCPDCGTFEDDHKIEQELVSCPWCNRSVKKLMSAPNIRTDAIDAYYHPAAQMWVDSKGSLKQLDEATGSTTYDYNAKPEVTQEQIRAKIDKTLEEDRRRSWDEAIQRYDSGNLNLTEEQRAICKERNNVIAHQTGKESFKHNGKEYKLRST